LTLNESGFPSVVPKKLLEALVPALPVSSQLCAVTDFIVKNTMARSVSDVFMINFFE